MSRTRRAPPVPQTAGVVDLGTMEASCRAIGSTIAEVLPEGVCFVLVLADKGDQGQLTYLSNILRPDVANMLRELLPHLEGPS